MSFFLKTFLLFGVCLHVFHYSLAQKKQVFFLKGDGHEVKHKDSAEFIRIIEEPDSVNRYFKVSEYYADNSRKFIGQASSLEPRIIYEGASIRFDKTGKKTEQIAYILGVPFGTAYYFHSNGRVKKEIDYNPDGRLNINNHSKVSQARLNSYFDSSGVQTVKDGNGYAILMDEDNILKQEGSYSEGLKNGIWKGFYKETGRFYEEEYKDGNLVSGIQRLPDGRKFDYTEIKEAPQSARGGLEFQKYFMKSFHYPREALERNISGKITMTFEIAADGTVTKIKVLPSSLNYSITHEATRVVKNAGKWHPAKLRGEPVNEVYHFALSFKARPPMIIRHEVREVRGSQPPNIRRTF